MFGNSNNESGNMDVKEIRTHLLQFLKTELQKYEGGEAQFFETIQLFLAPNADNFSLYQTAAYCDDERALKKEIQRLADNYNIELPEQWQLTVTYVDELPANASVADSLPAAVQILSRKKVTKTAVISRSALLKVLRGTGEKAEYNVSADMHCINIGRGSTAIMSSGFIRNNDIILTEEAEGPNRYVSGRHAHIEWSEKHNAFLLFADEGGLPPVNKTKVKSANGTVIKLHTSAVPHLLHDRDEILLGDQVLLQFLSGGNS
jgi:hypothetical protein